MTNIIKVELFRLKKSVLFWVMFGLTAASPVLSVLLSVLLNGIVNGSSNLLEMLKSTGLTNALLQDMAQILSDSAMWALFATSIVLSKEFTDGTMRNVMLANKSRAQLYFAYLLTSLTVAATYLLAYFAVVMIFAAPIFGFGGMSAGSAVTACFCSLAMGIMSLAFVQSCICMFMFVTRKQWTSCVLPLVICLFAPEIVNTVINLISIALAQSGRYISDAAIRWIPFVNLQQYNPASIDGAVVGMNLLYMSAFTALFVLSGYYTFKKADLK